MVAEVKIDRTFTFGKLDTALVVHIWLTADHCNSTLVLVGMGLSARIT